jgi:hypothetical protein
MFSSKMKLIMKRILSIISLLILIVANPGCKKFLNVEPVTSLSGNNYWKTEADAENFTKDVYRLFRSATISSVMLALGDYRCSPAKSSGSAFPRRYDFDYLANNDLKRAIAAPNDRTLPGYDPYTQWFQQNARYDLIPDWTPFYKTVQAANILEKEVDRITEPSFSEDARKRYKAEAVFMRCMSYFFLVRLFGDVPYYTNAYNQVPLPRTGMVTVLKNCVADLERTKENLPWTFQDPSNRAVRGMRGGAIALMMHMNMWLAGFDASKAQEYYKAVDVLGREIETVGEQQMGAYGLLPLNQSYLVSFGRSREGLFEIQLNDNYGETSGRERFKFSSSIVHRPFYPNDRMYSELVYSSSYMKRIYPETVPDGRKTEWFDNTIYDESGSFQFYKFFNRSAIRQGNDDNPIIFRYADVLLLHAEALAEIGQDADAQTLLNRIRARAGADPFPADPGEGKLKDAIYYERCKELMGEGHYYYDLVRTKKIMDATYCYHPLSFSAFTGGAWTWPIAAKALSNNPNMTLNNYWQ